MKLSEFSLISLLSKKLPLIHKDNVVLGIGDDAAVVKEGNSFFFLTTDLLAEGVHFLDSWSLYVEDFYFHLGRKLLYVSISDVASMGGIPLYALINLILPSGYDLEKIESFYDGISKACTEFNVSLVGGDTSRAKENLFSLFLVGKGERFMTRFSASIGDLVAVSGTLGDAAAGLHQLLEKKIKDHFLVNRFLLPSPRVKEGLELSRMGVKCCTDVSDGLVFNLYTLAKASSVSISIFSESIPLSSNLKRYAGEKALEYALYGGEDYELVVTFEEPLLKEVENLGFTVIGEVKEGRGVYLDGELLEEKGYDHFKEDLNEPS